VKRLGVLVAAVVALALAGGKGAPAQQLQANCSLFTKTPLWLDFADGSVPFWSLFARPGVTALASNLIFPPKLREGGAQTAYFDLYLNRRVGTTSAPADPATIVDKANKLYEYAAQSMDCSNPVIAENELFGSWLAVPWSKTNAQYRANVLLFLQTLRQRGAQPWLLVNRTPYTDGTAGDWWRQVADVAGIVREVYFPAPLIYKQGPIRGSRTLRQAFRNGILDFTKVGIPVSKLGVFLGFQTSKGTGGREGLEAKAWFRTVKWQALAARYVAREMNFSSIWSWGWAEWTTTPGEKDAAKPKAACVYLWTRSPSLCNGPSAAGKGFVRSRTEGQLILAPGLRCQLGHAAVRWSQINPILKLTGDFQRFRTCRCPASSAGRVRRHSRRRACHRQRPLWRFPRRVPGGDRRCSDQPLGGTQHHRRRAEARADREQVSRAWPKRTRNRRLPRHLRRLAGAPRAGQGWCSLAGRPSFGVCGRVCGSAATDDPLGRSLELRLVAARNGPGAAARAAAPARDPSGRERPGGNPRGTHRASPRRPLSHLARVGAAGGVPGGDLLA
jgi:hypothetical protein